MLMLKSLNEVCEKVRGSKKKTIAVAAAQDHEVLECAIKAREAGIADFILVGDSGKISKILTELGSKPGEWVIDNVEDAAKAGQKAIALVSEGKADIPMKGLIQTADFLRAVFNKEMGLVDKKALVSQISVAEYTQENRLILVTDCAINVAPDYEAKLKIAANAVSLAHRLGMETPKLAALAAVEVINPAMQETIDAAMLSKAAQRGQLKNCVVDGPLALDNALSAEAAKIKGITDSEVAGKADILLVPNLVSGNVIYKAMHYMAGYKMGSAVVGTKVPLIMTSRSDTAEAKFFSVAISVL